MHIEKIILLIGLPGAGKTTLGNSLLSNYNKNEALFIDDIGMVTNNAKEYLGKLKGDLKALIISDVFFCDSKVLNSAIYLLKELFPNSNIEKIYFENNKEKCLKNIAQRKAMGDTRKVENLVKLLSKKYIIDETESQRLIRCK